MSSLKNVLVIAVLLGVGYAMYTTLNSQRGPERPSEQTDGWPTSVDVQMPTANDAKPAATKNPFAVRGEQAAERVPPRDADSFRSPRGNALGTAAARTPSGPDDRGMPPFSPNDDKRSPVARETAPRSSIPARPPENLAGDVPGVAMTTDLPGHPSSPASAPAGVAPSRSRPESPNPNAASPFAGPSNTSPPNSATSATAPSTGVRTNFAQMMDEARRLLAQGKLAEVHLELSRLYGNPDLGLTPEETRQLIELLDQLTGTVVYSRQHLLEPPYVVKPDDTLQKIANSYNVPWHLLAKINGIRDPEHLVPDTQLKVVRGPFDAVVSLGRYELVLMLGDRYAGRFPIGIGRDNPQLEGSFPLRKKVLDPPYIASDCRFEPGDPNNPLGKLWLELADRLAIHGTNDKNNLRRADGRGTICLAPRDIEDLSDILTSSTEAATASKVTIRR